MQKRKQELNTKRIAVTARRIAEARRHKMREWDDAVNADVRNTYNITELDDDYIDFKHKLIDLKDNIDEILGLKTIEVSPSTQDMIDTVAAITERLARRVSHMKRESVKTRIATRLGRRHGRR